MTARCWGLWGRFATCSHVRKAHRGKNESSPGGATIIQQLRLSFRECGPLSKRPLEFGHFVLTSGGQSVSLYTVKHKEVVRRRDKLAANLPTAELLRGSLLQRTIRHKSGCPKCDRGEGHPMLVLAVSERGGKVRQISLRAEQKPVVEEWIANYHRLKSRIEEICELNQALLRPEP
jgi:hypothetical protein